MNIPALKKSPYAEILFLALISGLVYLPYITSLTYYLDDWYYIYDGVVFGPNIFHSMFSIDRPARGYFFDIYFSLFGPTPFPYHLGAYLWRLFAGICAFRLFSILWPGSRQLPFFGALLFILYPGYSWWVSAIEYQPMIASLALQVFSFLMTLEAIRTSRVSLKIAFLSAAILSGWAYIALVEYAIGMELFRLLCVFLLVSRTQPLSPLLMRIFITLRRWAWNMLIPLGFIFWRVFLFENQRKATDINLLLGNLRAAPADTLWRWSVSLFDSVTNAGIYAWFKQFYLQLSDANLKISNIGPGVLLIAVLVTLALVAFRAVGPMPVDQDGMQKKPAADAMFLGSVSLLAGVLPVVFANRYVNLSFYSHYGLPASLASTTLFVGLVSYLLPDRRTFYAAASVFVLLAAVTHSLIARKTIILENSLETFWWQASWRIPDLRPDATIMTLYPYKQVADNELGPADPVNLIYFREPQSRMPIHYPVSTLMPTRSNVDLILTTDKKRTVQYRVHKKIINYGNILILVQPTPQACVRVIGGPDQVFSDKDPESIRKISAFSRTENIRISMAGHTPPGFAFGPEPEHGWCYFFEKADLEIQRLDWQRASMLGDEVLALGLYPADVVEWFPFIRAYAMTGDRDKLERIATQTRGHSSFERQVCEAFRDPGSTLMPALETRAWIEKLFCD